MATANWLGWLAGFYHSHETTARQLCSTLAPHPEADVWRDEDLVSVDFSSNDAGTVRWLPIGGTVPCITSVEAAVSIIPHMMIQEFCCLHAQMEGGMRKTHELWVSLIAGERESTRRGGPWLFESSNTMCNQRVLLHADAAPGDRFDVPNLRATLGALLAFGLKARVAEWDDGDPPVWRYASDSEDDM